MKKKHNIKFQTRQIIMDNTVIEVLDREHGKKVIEFFKSKGVDTRDLEGVFCKADSDPARFYGVVDGRFDHWSDFSLKGVKIITLPEYPKVMEVSIYKDFRRSFKRVVFMYKNGKYLAWKRAETLEEADSKVEVTSWSYAREIAPELDIETFKINARDMETVTINARDTEFSWPQSNTSSHLLSKAFIIGAKEVVRTIQEDLDEQYKNRDNMNSMISEKERVLEFYNKKIKEFSGG